MPQTVNDTLIKKYLDGTATNEERQYLEQWYAALVLSKKTQEPVLNIAEMTSGSWQRLQRQIAKEGRPKRSIRTWWKYAAAAVLVISIGAYLYTHNQKDKPFVTQTNPNPVQNDVAPGGNRAILTLADGSKIILDSATNGTIAKEGNTKIDKINNEIVYSSADTRVSSLIAYNTMATPRGGQYQLTLPDGTKVWLNAESSITYPTVFNGPERKVSISGEAYFEVTRDKTKPFRVVCTQAGHPEQSEGSAEKELTIEVLGTHFNINAYREEGSINTTLLEGSVKLMPADAQNKNKKAVHTSLLLKPGQQGQFMVKDNKLSLASKPDIDQVMAWKNGVFDFNDVSLKEAMHQLARWYDVEVVYEGKEPEVTFVGKMGRDLNLSQVIKVLSALGVKFRIEGKRLIVSK